MALRGGEARMTGLDLVARRPKAVDGEWRFPRCPRRRAGRDVAHDNSRVHEHGTGSVGNRAADRRRRRLRRRRIRREQHDRDAASRRSSIPRKHRSRIRQRSNPTPNARKPSAFFRAEAVAWQRGLLTAAARRVPGSPRRIRLSLALDIDIPWATHVAAARFRDQPREERISTTCRGTAARVAASA